MTLRALAILSLVLTLAACATPAVQPPLAPPPGFAGPALTADHLVMDDGARLRLARWTPQGEPWAVIVALHGMNDSRASFRLAGPWWAEQGIETWAIDQRGFGESPGRGVWAGEARMVEDLRTAVALARARHPNAVIAVAGESMGGAVAVVAFASDRPPDADRVILLAPAVWGWSSQGPLNSAGLWIAARAMGARAVEAPEWAVRARPASDNRLELIRNYRDPNSLITTRFDALYGLVDLMDSASRRLGDIRAPTLLLYGAHDNVIQDRPMRQALERAGDRPNLRTAFYPDGWHLLNRDLQAEAVYGDVTAWLRDGSAAALRGGGGGAGAGGSLAPRSDPHGGVERPRDRVNPSWSVRPARDGAMLGRRVAVGSPHTAHHVLMPPLGLLTHMVDDALARTHLTGAVRSRDGLAPTDNAGFLLARRRHRPGRGLSLPCGLADRTGVGGGILRSEHQDKQQSCEHETLRETARLTPQSRHAKR